MVPPTCLAASKTTASAPKLRSANASESPEMPPPTMAITPEPHRESHSCSSPRRPQRPHTQRRRLNVWPPRSKDSAGLLRGRENPLYATRRPDLGLDKDLRRLFLCRAARQPSRALSASIVESEGGTS